MADRAAKKPPIVRLPPKSNLEVLLARSAQVSVIVVGLVAVVFALDAASFILAPISLGIVIGLMLGPIATRIERHGVAPVWSASVVVILFLLGAGLLMLALAAPISFWIGRIPQIAQELQLQLSQLREPLQIVENVREQLRAVTGASSEVEVTVEEDSPVESMATLAPTVIAQVLLFFASLYFFVATRVQIRNGILKLCFNRRLRWRAAHIFRDVEHLVSRYLLSILFINLGLGAAVAVAMYAIGIPSPLLWGALAGLLNIVVYIGPAIMAGVLFAVGLTVSDTLVGSLTPPAVYLALNLIESEFVTPLAIGRVMTLNPFVVLLALAFWIWLWGPIGSFVAIPALLIFYAIVSNIVPGADWVTGYHEPRRWRRN